MRKLILCLLMATLLLPMTVDLAAAQTGTESAVWRWTKPTTGSFAVRFECRVFYPDSLTVYLATSSSDSFATLTQPRRSKVWVRVAGVDASGRQGPWSPWGGYDPGAPGACGIPRR